MNKSYAGQIPDDETVKQRIKEHAIMNKPGRSPGRINYAAISGYLSNDPLETATPTGKLMMLFTLIPTARESGIRVACSGKAALLTRARCVKGSDVLCLGKLGSIGGNRTVMWANQVQCLDGQELIASTDSATKGSGAPAADGSDPPAGSSTLAAVEASPVEAHTEGEGQ